MATVDLTQTALPLFGTGAPKSEKYRFYTCELKATSWECQKGNKIIPNSIATQLIPIESWIPTFIDPLLLSHRLKKPVAIKPPTS